MSKNFAVAFGIGIVCIAIAVAGILYMQRGAQINLDTRVLKVRTAPLDENNSVAAIDFRLGNNSDYPFMVRAVTVTMQDAGGAANDGYTISEPDARRMFAGLPLLGQKYNDSLIMNDKVPPHASWDRMIAASFKMPVDKLEARKRLAIHIEEVDGKVVDIAER